MRGHGGRPCRSIQSPQRYIHPLPFQLMIFGAAPQGAYAGGGGGGGHRPQDPNFPVMKSVCPLKVCLHPDGKKPKMF